MQHTGKLLLLRDEFLRCKQKASSLLLQGSTHARHDLLGGAYHLLEKNRKFRR